MTWRKRRWVGVDAADDLVPHCGECGIETDVNGPCPSHQPIAYAAYEVVRRTASAGVVEAVAVEGES